MVECPDQSAEHFRGSLEQRQRFRFINHVHIIAQMIHHIVLFKLKPEITPERLEVLLMQTRMQLLKIPVAMNVRCGRRIDPNNEWPFFFAVEFDSKERMAMFTEEPIYIKFIEETIKPNTEGSLVLDYETDPKRKYS